MRILSDLADPVAVEDPGPQPPRNHIFCDCNPDVMFCGITLGPAGTDVFEMPDGDECPDCFLVWMCGFCPYCGSHWTVDDYKSRGL